MRPTPPRQPRLAASLLLTLLLAPLPAGAAEKPEPARLTEDGKALLPVVVGRGASQRVRQAAGTLARYLERIGGAHFDVTAGDGKTGIAVGLPAHFPDLPAGDLPDPADPTRGEDYLLRSHARGVHVLGTTDLAVEHAVWDLLDRLGYRQFFPGDAWEVVPHAPSLSVAVTAKEHPAYYDRRIWYGFGPWDYAAAPYADWCARNRATSGISITSGHAYDGIIARHREEFRTHPEYLGLVNGERKSSKFCISNPGLRRLVVDDALAYFREHPEAQSVSVEPSDGGGWCECEQCKALGSISDRALLLANEVAEAVTARFPDKYVGMYAYSQHSPPPSIKVHPRVVIGVATGFISGGYTVDELLDGWRKQGATLGIREYYSVNTWDRDLPGAARASRPDYLKETVPHFHARGARFLSAESGDNWGPNGLGYYLAARMLWDVRAADRVDEIIADFLEKAFGPAREPMADFYRLLNGPRRPLLSDDLIGRLYRSLAEARRRSDDPAVGKRLDDMVLYVRYVELYFAYSTAEGQARQKAFEDLIRHAYRMRTTMMVHTKALYRDLAARDKTVTIPAGAAWDVPEGKNPWKRSEPFTRAELDGFVTTGVAGHKLLDFEPVSFSENLVPAGRLGLPDVTPGSMGLYSRGERTYSTWAEDGPVALTLTVRAGLVYGNRGEAKLDLFAPGDADRPAAHAAAPPDKAEHRVELTSASRGLHRLEVTDATAGTSVAWPDGTPMTVRSSPEAPASFAGRWSLYFYVPKGTKVVGGYSSGPGTLLDGGGKVVHTFDGKPGYFSVPVPAGADGALWQFHQCAGQRLLMTVPPYLARSGKELLLPAEVVEKDGGKR
jgi:hypothetical protein